MMDTRQATVVNGNGSIAQFNFSSVGNDQFVENQSASCQLLQFQATHSIYNINSYNNQLQLLIQTQNVYQTGSITASTIPIQNTIITINIPVGSYYILDLINILNTQILLQCPSTARSTDPTKSYYTGFGVNDAINQINPIDFNVSTGKVTFHLPTTSNFIDWTDTCSFLSSSGSSIIPLSGDNTTPNLLSFCQNIYLGFYLIQCPLLYHLGLPRTNTTCFIPNTNLCGYGVPIQPTFSISSNQVTVTYRTNTKSNLLQPNFMYSISFTNGDFTPCNVVDLSYPRCIYLCISGMNTNNRCSAPNCSYGNVFACIPISSKFGDQILWEPTAPFPNLCPGLQINSFQVQTLDEFGNLINWNNGAWRAVLGIQWSIDQSSTEDIGLSVRQPLHSLPHDPLQKESYQHYGQLPFKKRAYNMFE